MEIIANYVKNGENNYQLILNTENILEIRIYFRFINFLNINIISKFVQSRFKDNEDFGKIKLKRENEEAKIKILRN